MSATIRSPARLALVMKRLPAPPADVFVYPLSDSWRDRIWRTIDDLVTEAVRAKFVADPPDYVVCDDLSWLDDLILHVARKSVDMKTLTADRLGAEYRAFRPSHATCTSDVGLFYREGLRLLRADDAEARARALWLGRQFPHATEAKLQEAIADINARAGGWAGRAGVFLRR